MFVFMESSTVRFLQPLLRFNLVEDNPKTNASKVFVRITLSMEDN